MLTNAEDVDIETGENFLFIVRLLLFLSNPSLYSPLVEY